MNLDFLGHVEKAFQAVQDEQVASIASFDGALTVTRDLWDRSGGGGGDTRVFTGGRVLEKGGLNFSAVRGEVSAGLRQQLQTKATRFAATGVSSVLHPNNPHVPIIHMNVRYFTLDDGTWWFGGGIDLTPHYILPSEAKAFHLDLKAICDAHDVADFAEFKSWADRYFYSPHRGESRGVGGIFFDHMGRDGGVDADKALAFCVDLAGAYSGIYARRASAFVERSASEEEKAWQGMRRGRYVEFNLVHDRGTRFGLVSGGRTESILMSLPATANWSYNHQPEAGSREAQTLDWLKKGEEGVDWLSA